MASSDLIRCSGSIEMLFDAMQRQNAIQRRSITRSRNVRQNTIKRCDLVGHDAI
jgi:hypothetical protein